jgi:hypothetical protein
MAIATIEQLADARVYRQTINKWANTANPGRPLSLWRSGAWPLAGAIPPSGSGQVPTNATAGAFPFQNPPVGALYVSRIALMTSVAATVILADRLVHTSGLSGLTTSTQPVNSVAVDRPDNTGRDVELWVEWYGLTGNAAPNAWVTYTNQDGVSGQVSPATQLTANASASGMMAPMALAAGDTGVRAVQDFTLTGTFVSAGNMGVTLLRRLAEIPLPANTLVERDAISLGMPGVSASAALQLIVWPTATPTGNIFGYVDLAAG